MTMVEDLMNAPSNRTYTKRVLVVYYSPEGQKRLESFLQALPGVEVFFVNGRVAEAVEAIGKHPAEVVVIDQGAEDISVGQAVRQVGQVLPRSLVVTVQPLGQKVHVYRGGHLIGVAEDLGSALRQYDLTQDARRA